MSKLWSTLLLAGLCCMVGPVLAATEYEGAKDVDQEVVLGCEAEAMRSGELEGEKLKEAVEECIADFKDS